MYQELIGKYLNGYKIVKIEKDPFIKGQINLWTDEEQKDYFGDRSIVKFFLREDGNSNKIYQELIDKEVFEQKTKIQKIKEICNKVPNDWSICGIDVIHEIEEVLKEVETMNDAIYQIKQEVDIKMQELSTCVYEMPIE